LIHEVRDRTIRIEAVVLDSGSCPARTFLDELDRIQRAQMVARFDKLIRDHPTPLSKDKFRQVDETGICEFKTQLRVLCFRHGGNLLLTHGCGKVGKKEFRKQITRAKQIRAVFERRLKSNGK
jgi:hypothetical protein